MLSRFLFGRPVEELLARFKRVEQVTDLNVSVIVRNHRGLGIPIVIAEKRTWRDERT